MVLSAASDAIPWPRRKLRVAVAAQTNAQADEICQRLVGRAKPVPCFRFYSSGGGPAEDARIGSIVKAQEIPEGPCVVVATTAKWEFSVPSPFDVVFVDEAWQMPWGRFLGLGNVASRFVLIGDPGQIPPVVPVDASRWETAPRPPHHAAPNLVLADPALKPMLLELPVSRRLPHDSAELVNSFYDFRFGAYAAAGERRVELSGKGKDGLDSALDHLSAASISGVTLACLDGNPPLEVDDEIAQLVIETSRRLLARKAVVIEEDQKVQRALTAQDIGIVASHRVMLARIDEFLPAALRKHIRVDTAERWQGLERAVMIAVHPLSGVSEPSAFDLATGPAKARACAGGGSPRPSRSTGSPWRPRATPATPRPARSARCRSTRCWRQCSPSGGCRVGRASSAVRRSRAIWWCRTPGRPTAGRG